MAIQKSATDCVELKIFFYLSRIFVLFCLVWFKELYIRLMWVFIARLMNFTYTQLVNELKTKRRPLYVSLLTENESKQQRKPKQTERNRKKNEKKINVNLQKKQQQNIIQHPKKNKWKMREPNELYAGWTTDTLASVTSHQSNVRRIN